MTNEQPPYEGIDRRENRMPLLSVPEGMRNEVTGLPNETAFNLLAQDAVNRMPGQFAEIDMDVDGLGEHNLEYGHRDANQFLRTTGEILTHALRQEDIVGLVAHPHGDEFRMLVTGVSEDEQVGAIINRLRSTLDEYGISGSFGGRVHSVGETAEQLAVATDNLAILDKVERKLARYTPEQLANAKDIIRQANDAGIKIRDLTVFADIFKDEL